MKDADISYHKQIEFELKQNEERYRNLVENVSSIILGLDNQGNVNFINKFGQDFFGYDKEELIGRSLLETILPKTESSGRDLEEMISSLCQNPESFASNINENLLRDGTRVWVQWTNKALLDEKRQVNEILCVGTDITSRKNFEEELEEVNRNLEQQTALANEMAVQAEAANQAKSEFLANMSHEIRTPMNGVIGMTGLLLDTDLTEEQQHYAETIRSSGEALLALINDILDFSKIEAGKLDLEILDFDLRAMLDDFAQMMNNKAEEKGLEFICAADPEVPSLLQGDPGRLRQILTNLTSNAFKFTDQGEVVVQACLEVESDQEAVIKFSVRDTGIGIPEDKQDKLFESFTQIDASVTRQFGGTGLGLAISKQLSEMMDGEIGVNSQEGRGSKFWFTARLSKQPVQEQRALSDWPDLRGVKILIVDDNATNREILMRQIESWQMQPVEVSSGADALQELYSSLEHGGPYKVALLDMQMPGMDGKALGRAIRAEQAFDQTFLVMMTSMGKRGDASKLKEIGFSAFLTKPVRPKDLFDCLARLLSEKESIDDQEKYLITKHTLKEMRRSARILLVEDNFTNQQVAVGMIKKLGLRVDAVGNGIEAIKALEKIDYDLVLMDVQMPEMDGFEATRRIREAEDSGRWSVVSGQKREDSGRWSVVSSQKAEDSGRWSEIRCARPSLVEGDE